MGINSLSLSLSLSVCAYKKLIKRRLDRQTVSVCRRCPPPLPPPPPSDLSVKKPAHILIDIVFMYVALALRTYRSLPAPMRYVNFNGALCGLSWTTATTVSAVCVTEERSVT